MVLRGDLNVIRFSHERSPCSRERKSMRTFDNFIREGDLGDITLANAKFIRSNFRDMEVKSRLVRFLFSPDWEADFQSVRRIEGSRMTSDHFPLILDTNPVDWGPSPFRFANMWLIIRGF